MSTKSSCSLFGLLLPVSKCLGFFEITYLYMSLIYISKKGLANLKGKFFNHFHTCFPVELGLGKFVFVFDFQESYKECLESTNKDYRKHLEC